MKEPTPPGPCPAGRSEELLWPLHPHTAFRQPRLPFKNTAQSHSRATGHVEKAWLGRGVSVLPALSRAWKIARTLQSHPRRRGLCPDRGGGRCPLSATALDQAGLFPKQPRGQPRSPIAAGPACRGRSRPQAAPATAGPGRPRLGQDLSSLSRRSSTRLRPSNAPRRPCSDPGPISGDSWVSGYQSSTSSASVSTKTQPPTQWVAENYVR